MKNGDPRSAQWIKRKLKEWRRLDEATQTTLSLITIDPTPSLDEIGTWTDEQCLLAEDWAAAVHLRASDNDVRVPAVPPHLVAYRRRYPRRTPKEAAVAAVDAMCADNGACFKPTEAQWTRLEVAIERMQKAGCFFTDAEITLWAAGAEHEAIAHFRRFDGFAQAQWAMVSIFEGKVHA